MQRHTNVQNTRLFCDASVHTVSVAAVDDRHNRVARKRHLDACTVTGAGYHRGW
jgi:hypothetical protein